MIFLNDDPTIKDQIKEAERRGLFDFFRQKSESDPSPDFRHSDRKPDLRADGGR